MTDLTNTIDKTELAVVDCEGDGAARDMPPPPTREEGRLSGPRVISMEKVNWAIKGTKPGPKCSKIRKEKFWNRPQLETFMVTSSDDEDEQLGGSVMTRSSSTNSVCSASAEISGASEKAGEKKKGRGRPETTGEYRIVKARKAEKEILERKRAVEEEIEAIVNPDYAIDPAKALRARNEVAGRMEELRYSPTVDLLARMTGAADLVLKAAIKSTNLKGTIRGELKRAHGVLAAGASVLASRADKESEGESGGELALLRTELQMAREDIKRLRDKGESERKLLEEYRRKIEEMEDALSSPRRKKGRTSRADKSEEEGKEIEIDVEMIEEGVDNPLPLPPPPVPVNPQAILPPREEWPAAMRPPIKGVSKKIEDGVPSPDVGRMMNLDERIIERLDSLLPKWLESRGFTLQPTVPPRPQHGATALQRGGEAAKKKKSREEALDSGKEKGQTGKEAGKRTKGQMAQPSQPPRNKEARPSGSGGPSKEPRPSATERSLPSRESEGKEGEVPWTKVIGRKAKKMEAKAGKERTSDPERNGGKPRVLPVGKNTGTKKVKRRRPPRTAAVVLTCPEGRYNEIMQMARARVDIGALNIDGLKLKRAQTGAFILEVPGQDGAGKADALAEKLQEALIREEGVKVTRPVKTSELRIRDIDDSVTRDEVVMAIAETGGCDILDIKVGEPQMSPNGLKSVWVRCPIPAANKLATAGKIKLGWVFARVDLLDARPLQCYKCLQPGHVRQKCPNDWDNSDRCYRCGGPGHRAQGCVAPPHCLVCEEAGKPAGHRMGGSACPLPKRGRKKEGDRGNRAPRAPSTAAAASTVPAEKRGVPSVTAMEVEVMPPPLEGKRTPGEESGQVGDVPRATLNNAR